VRVRGAVALAGLAISAAAGPAVSHAASRPRAYEIRQASGAEQVTFTSTDAAGCQSRGACGTSGTISYSFGGKPRNGLFVLVPRQAGFAFFDTTGLTNASVTTAGASQPCTDTVRHRTEFFALEPSRSRFRYVSHFGDPDLGDYLDTRCAGPIELDLAKAGALPGADFAARGFTGRKIKFSAVGSKPFTSGGFTGTVNFRFSYTVVRTRSSAALGLILPSGVGG
jgi:hypothetical protein